MISQKPIVVKLTPISQEEAGGSPLPQLISPIIEEYGYRYICGHCDAELSRRMEPITDKGVTFDCPVCQNFSMYDGRSV